MDASTVDHSANPSDTPMDEMSVATKVYSMVSMTVDPWDNQRAAKKAATTAFHWVFEKAATWVARSGSQTAAC
jgi:hypothetical protein